MRLPLVIAGWGAADLALTVPLVIREADIAPVMLAAAGAAAVVTGLVMLTRPDTPPEREELPDLSVPTAFAGLGTIIVFAGMAAGAWLSVIGAGVLAAALVGIVREQVSLRRERNP
jgi:hypothetical protein